MTERIKLIWDFHGPNAKPTATHHVKHLGEYAVSENLQNTLTGVEEVTPNHHIAYMVVERNMMDSLRQILKPTRGQLYQE